MNEQIYDALATARAIGVPAVLVTVLAVGADAPSSPGAKLVVGPEGVLAGTLGCSEFDTAGIALAREAAATGAPLRRVVSTPGHDPAEDRSIELFAELHVPMAAVIVLGATAVGRAVAELARLVGRRAVLIAGAHDVGLALRAAPVGPADAVVLSDHDGEYVDECLRFALGSDAGYVGMLGSRKHAPLVVARLREAGVPEAHLARLHSPIGLDIGSQGAQEIALSIMAEIVAASHGRAGGSLSGAV